MLIQYIKEIYEGVRIALSALRENKFRSTLTTLGIIIGIVAVTVMATAIEGLNRAFSTSISSLGSDVLYVDKMPWFSNRDFFKYNNRKDIKISDAESIIKYASYVKAVAPVVRANKTVKHREKSLGRVLVLGTTTSYRETANVYPKYGRFLSEIDVGHSRYVTVIGSEIAKNLFENEDPIGSKIWIDGRPYKVIGILEKKGNLLGMMDLDSRVIIPIGTFGNSFGTRRHVSIQVKVKDQVYMEDSKDELTGIMRRVRRVPPGAEDDFSINQQSVFTDMYNNMTGAIYGAGIVITALSLLVGGIGVMNIMLVSVTERTREIGIRKALGARRRSILFQFLIESSAICLFGGIIALAIGFGISVVIDKFLLPTAMPLSWAL
ncbi:MAG: ABC transporter permease, partial [Candidatus Marinimicrobia bacterium]|nr:ABC transporter permease [Candidatus Neomarinimicrobiota bacterium]